MRLDHLSTYAKCAKMILVYMPYVHRDDDQNDEILAPNALREESKNNTILLPVPYVLRTSKCICHIC